MAAPEAPLVLGPLSGEERKAMAAHYVAIAKSYYALARTLDPAAKVPKTPGRKRKGEEAAGGGGEPKKKREATLYTQFIQEHLPTFRKENPTLDPKACMAAVAGQWKTSKENPKAAGFVGAPALKPVPAAAGGEEDEAERARRKAEKKARKAAKAAAAAAAGEA